MSCPICAKKTAQAPSLLFRALQGCRSEPLAARRLRRAVARACEDVERAEEEVENIRRKPH
jgi:hypothetical protein